MKRDPCMLITIATTMLFLFFTIIAAPLFAQAPANLPGTIAYFRVVGATQSDPGTSELHLVNPDGSNDRIIYSAPRGLTTIYPDPGWRPDGMEIAFISAQEFACSPYNSDIFSILPDGSGLRRITNAPKSEELAQLPKGSVTVTLENLIADESIFFVYVEGAMNLKQIVLLPGASATLTVDSVADFGRLQFIYVKSGSGTWLNPSVYVDVVPGQTVEASNLLQITSGFGPFEFRIGNFTWRSDGSEIAYLVEAGLKEFLPAYPANGQLGQDLFTGNTTLVNGNLAWSPVSDEFLYYSILSYPQGIYRGVKGSDVITHTLVLETDYVSDLTWIPDGSGFLYSTQNFGYISNQIVKYDFNSNQTTVLVDGSIYLVGATPSPDGQYFAFADRADENSPYDLFGMAIDGSQQWNIASDIVSWDWGGMAETDVESFDQVEDFELLSNYPNPFNPSTKIRYSLPQSSNVTLTVFDILGNEIETLVNEDKSAGTYEVNWNATGLPSGVYFYRIRAGSFNDTKKMILIK